MYFRYWCQCPDPYSGLNCERNCLRTMNIAFVLDYSGSADDSSLVQSFVSKVVYGLPVGASRVSVAAVTFSDSANILFYLNSYSGQEQVQSALVLGPSGGHTNTAAALRVLTDTIFTPHNGMMPNRANFAVVVTRGTSDVNQDQTVPEANRLRQQGVEVYVVAEGSSPNYDEINGIASSPSGTHVFALTDSGAVDSVSGNLLDRLCSG